MSEFVNEYKLQCCRKIRPLGEKGNLWLIEDTVTEKLFVMRKLPQASQAVYERLAEIHHPNLTEITDVFPHDGSVYVMEEYLDWKLLSDAAEEQRLSKKQVFSVGKQLLRALSALHEHGIVHRDVKPENIMISERGAIKLIDFDIARIFSEEKARDTSPKGSRAYAPPEQFGFAQSDCRADLYAFGVTLNELASGELPEVKQCTGRLGLVAGKCMQFDPGRRYQSAAQALKHLERLEKVVPHLIWAGILILALGLGGMFLAGQAQPDGLKSPVSIEQASAGSGYRDRIITARTPEQYPAVLMAEDKPYEFTANTGSGVKTALYAEKTAAGLTLSCAAEDGSKAEFQFEDVFSDTYASLGYSINTDFETTSPEYELLLNDVNEDGKMDILITLAWRSRIGTPASENRYYLTEYSTLWLVYQDGKDKWNCSEPLYFEGCVPALQTDTLLYDFGKPAWYSFQKGTWHAFY